MDNYMLLDGFLFFCVVGIDPMQILSPLLHLGGQFVHLFDGLVILYYLVAIISCNVLLF